MFGWGRLRFPAFLKLMAQLVPQAWKSTRHIQTGQEIEFSVKLMVGE